MFSRTKSGENWVQAQALVLDKKVYASKEYSGTATACRYELRVKFEDGSTAEMSRRAFGETLASAAAVGELIPVRHDPADRSKVELDHDAVVERQKATKRDVRARALARGEEALGSSTGAGLAAGSQEQPDTGRLRVGDAERELVAGLLTEHAAEGRLTEEELEDRVGIVYASQTRGQARSVLDDLPLLAPDGAVLPEWLRVPATATATVSAPMPVSGGLPTDAEMTHAYEAWRAKKLKASADTAAHKRIEAAGDKKATFLAFRALTISRAEEKSARAKLETLRRRRPDWTETPAG